MEIGSARLEQAREQVVGVGLRLGVVGRWHVAAPRWSVSSMNRPRGSSVSAQGLSTPATIPQSDERGLIS